MLDDRHTLQRLDALYGDRRADLDATHRVSDRRDLVALVDAASTDAQPLSATPPVARASRRRRRRVDVMSVVIAGTAAIALVTAGVIGGVQVATASPAGDALRALKADEATITSAAEGAQAAQTRLETDIASADAAAEQLGTTLAATRVVPDPAAGVTRDSDATVAIVDEASFDAFLKTLSAYRAQLQAIEIPTLPEPYERAELDDESLSQVGSAIDDAQLHLSELDTATAALRTSREEVRAATATFAAETSRFAQSYLATAQRLTDEHDAAGDDAQVAVSDAAGALAGADLLSEQGVAALSTYAAAVSEMLDENLRVLLEREAREREERRNQTVDPTPVQPGTGEPTDPPTDPVDPVEPTVPPTQPEEPSEGG